MDEQAQDTGDIMTLKETEAICEEFGDAGLCERFGPFECPSQPATGP
jgi:hypothetical protein